MSFGNRTAQKEPAFIGVIGRVGASCRKCHTMRRDASIWSTNMCTTCDPVGPQSVIDIEQDRRDEAAEMSALWLATRWV